MERHRRMAALFTVTLKANIARSKRLGSGACFFLPGPCNAASGSNHGAVAHEKLQTRQAGGRSVRGTGSVHLANIRYDTLSSYFEVIDANCNCIAQQLEVQFD